MKPETSEQNEDWLSRTDRFLWRLSWKMLWVRYYLLLTFSAIHAGAYLLLALISLNRGGPVAALVFLLASGIWVLGFLLIRWLYRKFVFEKAERRRDD